MYLGHPAGLGSLTDPKLTANETLALASLAGGLVGTLGLYFFATGRTKEAYMIGVASGIVGAFVGAAKILRGHEHDNEPIPHMGVPQF